MLAERYGIQRSQVHIGTLGVSSERGTAPSVQRILVGVFWVGDVGDMSEDLEFTRTGQSNPPPEKNAPPPPFDAETYKQSVFHSAQRLVQDCSRTHRHCLPPSLPTFLPTRLLEIHSGSNQTVKLMTTSSLSPGEETNATYIALSYRWGNPPHNPIRLTAATSQSLHLSISTSSIPWLFQDVISLAQLLGVKHIWIDALCIQQDDPLDWEREAAVMGAIYRNAWLVVGATSSKDSSYRLAPQPFQRVPIPVVTFDDTGLGREEGKGPGATKWDSVVCSTKGGSITWGLHERGWCFQEIMLARRFLDFDSNGLQLHCCKGDFRDTHGEDGQSGLQSDASDSRDLDVDSSRLELPKYNRWQPADFRRPWAFRHFWSRFLELDLNKQQLQPADMRVVWQELLQMYTNRRLTYSSDLLPALGGIASEYLEKVGDGDEYCGGLWKSRFVQDLCWTANHEAVPHKTAHKTPSWSWASVRGSVDYEYAELGEQRTRLVEVVCEKGTNPFGELKGGYAVLEGPVFTCFLTSDSGKWALRRANMPRWLAPTFTPDVAIEAVTYCDAGSYGASKISAKRANEVGGKTGIQHGCQSEVWVLQLFHLEGKEGIFLVLGLLDPKGVEFQRLGLIKACLDYFYSAEDVDATASQNFEPVTVV